MLEHLVNIQYGFEIWTLKKADIAKINPFEKWGYRRMLDICGIQKKSNKWILKTIKEKPAL